jgi:hypothetical protein
LIGRSGYSVSFGRCRRGFLEGDPVLNALLEHVHGNSAATQNFIVEGADVEFVTELIFGVLA